MSRREKKNEKKGISLVGFIIILVVLVCIEGIYIVKLRGNDDSESYNSETIALKNEIEQKENVEVKNTEESKEDISNNKNSLNNKIISSLGYNVNTMIDTILDNVISQTESENVVKFVDNNVTENVVTTQEMQEKREDYKTIIIKNLDNEAIFNSLKFEKGKLSCEYNIKNLLNLLGLESKSYVDLGANENNVAMYIFN